MRSLNLTFMHAGWLEMDIMLGNWVRYKYEVPTDASLGTQLVFIRVITCPCQYTMQADANLNQMEGAQLDQFAEVLEMENPDLYKWLTGDSADPTKSAYPADLLTLAHATVTTPSLQNLSCLSNPP